MRASRLWFTFAIKTSALHVGSIANRVLYEHTGTPVTESIYDIMFKQRLKLLR